MCIFWVGFLPTFTCLLSSESLSVYCNMTRTLQEQTRCGTLPATTTQQPDGEVVFVSLTIDLPLAYILLCSQEFSRAWPLLFLSSEANYKSDKIIERSLLFLPHRLVLFALLLHFLRLHLCPVYCKFSLFCLLYLLIYFNCNLSFSLSSFSNKGLHCFPIIPLFRMSV